MRCDRNHIETKNKYDMTVFTELTDDSTLLKLWGL